MCSHFKLYQDLKFVSSWEHSLLKIWKREKEKERERKNESERQTHNFRGCRDAIFPYFQKRTSWESWSGVKVRKSTSSFPIVFHWISPLPVKQNQHGLEAHTCRWGQENNSWKTGRVTGSWGWLAHYSKNVQYSEPFCEMRRTNSWFAPVQSMLKGQRKEFTQWKMMVTYSAYLWILMSTVNRTELTSRPSFWTIEVRASLLHTSPEVHLSFELMLELMVLLVLSVPTWVSESEQGLTDNGQLSLYRTYRYTFHRKEL